MARVTVRSVGERLGRAFANAQYMGWTPVYTGRRISPTETTLVGAPDGMTLVRWPDDSYEFTAVYGMVLEADIPYWVGLDKDGNPELKKPRNQEGTDKFGNLLYTVSQPPSSDATPQTVGGIGFVPGRLQLSDKGGLWVHPCAFNYDGGYWDDGSLGTLADAPDETVNDFNLASYLPSTPGYSAWARVYFDPVLFLIAAVKGTEIEGDRRVVLDVQDVPNIPIPAGVYPLGAVSLSNGQTELVATDIADARYHIAVAQPHVLVVSREMCIPDGVTMCREDGVRIAAGGLMVHGGLVII